MNKKSPKADKNFGSRQKMAVDSSLPAELREVGRVLSRILAGDTGAIAAMMVVWLPVGVVTSVLAAIISWKVTKRLATQ